LNKIAVGENRAEILVHIKEILGRLKLLTNTDQLDEQTGLLGRGVGLDSIEVLQLIVAIEEEFELTIDDDELAPEHFRSIGTLITFIEQRL
jgi:acyl carrier protein